MTIKEIIEKAIKGEWKMKDTIIVDFRIKKDLVIFFCNGRTINDFDDVLASLTLEQIVLDPKFWEAVGKTEKWWKTMEHGTEWEEKMHQMINFLIEGGNIESYIKTL